jgi:hypothetical protein
VTDAYHRLHLSDADVVTLEHAAYSHKSMLQAAATVMHGEKIDTRAPSLEADRLAHVTSLIQLHVRGQCDCPHFEGGND